MSKNINPKFTINNFRMFNKPQTFELAPITILTGPNNSGKSSLVKSLSLLNNNKINGFLRNFIDYNSNKSRLFGSKNIFNDDNQNLEYSFEIIRKGISKLPIIYKVSFDSSGALQNFSISHKNQVLISYVYVNNLYDYFDISFNLDLLMKTFKIKSTLFEIEFEDDFDLNSDMKNTYISTEKKITDNFGFSIKNDTESPIGCDFQNFEKEKIVEVGGWAYVNFHSTIREVNKELIEQVFRYLEDKIQKDLNSKFYTNYKLCMSKNGLILKNKLLFLVNQFDITLFEYEFHELLVNRNVKNRNIDLTDETILLNSLVKKYIENTNNIDDIFGHWLDPWLKKFEIGKYISVDNFNGEIANIVIHGFNNEKRDLSACGTGVTQIISLLLLRLLDHSFINNINSHSHITSQLKLENDIWLIYLEEPESNLHPNWQSLFMELIIDINQKSGIRFIIETHSEYMLRKLQNLIAKKSVSKDKFKIYYFNSDKYVSKEEPKVKEIKLKTDGVMENSFGPGFYDEAINLEFELLTIRKYQSN